MLLPSQYEGPKKVADSIYRSTTRMKEGFLVLLWLLKQAISKELHHRRALAGLPPFILDQEAGRMMVRTCPVARVILLSSPLW